MGMWERKDFHFPSRFSRAIRFRWCGNVASRLCCLGRHSCAAKAALTVLLGASLTSSNPRIHP
jgi:hypothetical protein